MEEKFALLNLKMTELWDYSIALTHALEALMDETEIVTWKQKDKIRKLRDTLYDAAVDANMSR